MLSRVVENFEEVLKNKSIRMPIIAVYDSPTDFKAKFVARLFDLDKATPYAVISDNLEGIHKVIPPGLTCLPPRPGDVKSLVETWF